MDNNFTNFNAGLHYFSQGFRLIQEKGVRRYVVVPFLINLLLFIGLTFMSSHYFTALVQKIDHFLPSWLQWLNTLLWLLFTFSIAIVFLYTFTLIANIITAPFNAFLSEKIASLKGHQTRTLSLTQSLHEAGKSVGRSIQMLGYYLPRALGLLIISFIPVINLAAPFLWFLFNSWSMSLQYFNYPFENNGLSFQKLKGYLRERRMAAFGFGIPVMLFTFIPLVNILIISVATAGATAYWVDAKQGRLHEEMDRNT